MPEPVTARLVSGVLGAVALGAASLGTLYLSLPPTVAAFDDPPYLVVETSHPGGSLWVEVESESPINTSRHDQRAELTFTVTGARGSTVDFILGGALASTSPQCAGAAFDLHETSLSADDTTWDTLVSYRERRPGSGKLFNASGMYSVGREEAESWARAQTLLVALDVKLSGASTKSWSPDTTKPVEYETATATLNCTFDSAALLVEPAAPLFQQQLRFRAPDLIATHLDQDGSGVVSVSYRLDTTATDAVREVRSTFTETTRHVDDDGAVVTDYSGQWWWRSAEGRAGILLTGGGAVLEPQRAEDERSWWRLAAGVLASLSVATVTATIAYAVDRGRSRS